MLNVAANILRKGDIKLRKGKYHNSKSICKSFLVLKKSKKTEQSNIAPLSRSDITLFTRLLFKPKYQIYKIYIAVN